LKSGFLSFWRQKAADLQLQTYALYFAYRDPRVPWYAKGFIALVVAYAFSPIDLIPDFIPVLGYLDDLVIVPLGVYFAVKMIPAPVMEECRAKAKAHLNEEKPIFKFMGVLIIAVWVIILLVIGFVLYKTFRK
jgi:uncharacterized membrane protein YkvA (DUF1232 family)